MESRCESLRVAAVEHQRLDLMSGHDGVTALLEISGARYVRPSGLDRTRTEESLATRLGMIANRDG
jgi:hypothetical protein